MLESIWKEPNFSGENHLLLSTKFLVATKCVHTDTNESALILSISNSCKLCTKKTSAKQTKKLEEVFKIALAKIIYLDHLLGSWHQLYRNDSSCLNDLKLDLSYKQM